jgi:hypothetical protein
MITARSVAGDISKGLAGDVSPHAPNRLCLAACLAQAADEAVARDTCHPLAATAAGVQMSADRLLARRIKLAEAKVGENRF